MVSRAVFAAKSCAPVPVKEYSSPSLPSALSFIDRSSFAVFAAVIFVYEAATRAVGSRTGFLAPDVAVPPPPLDPQPASARDSALTATTTERRMRDLSPTKKHTRMRTSGGGRMLRKWGYPA